MDTFRLWGANIGKAVAEGVDATGSLARQHLGPAEPITPFPEGYDRLHKRATVLADAHKQLVQVVSDFSKCRYKYPENLLKTVNQVTQTVLDGINNLSHATSFPPASADNSSKPDTFYHGLSRAAQESAALLRGIDDNESLDHPDGLNTLAEVLENYADCCKRIGEAQIVQDAAIKQEILSEWGVSTKQIADALKHRKAIETKRGDYDSIKRKISKHHVQLEKRGRSAAGGTLQQLGDGAINQDGQPQWGVGTNPIADSLKQRTSIDASRGVSDKGKQGGAGTDDNSALQQLEDMNTEAEESYEATVREATDEVTSVLTMQRSIEQVQALAKLQLNFHNAAAAELELLIPEMEKLEKVQLMLGRKSGGTRE